MTNILIKSDNNELAFVEIQKIRKGEPMYIFRYIKSETKLGQLIGFTEKELEKIQMENG